ncbi:MAG TPA: hypothetical protein LFV92_06480 [Rickettsia endosymbiont of Ceroptres masudai]|nr:hypothetical protein [Rickettsia endosymbiont of Ceroptres masudai]
MFVVWPLVIPWSSRYCCIARLCHSRVGGNPVKHIKNKFFICLFYQRCNFYINIEVIFLDPRFRGDDIEWVFESCNNTAQATG